MTSFSTDQETMSCRDFFASLEPGCMQLAGSTVQRSTMPRSRSLDDLRDESGDEDTEDAQFSQPTWTRNNSFGRSPALGRYLDDELPHSSDGFPSRQATLQRSLSELPPDCFTRQSDSSPTHENGEPPVSPSVVVSPKTSSLLDSMRCELMSPCISVKGGVSDRNLCARPFSNVDGSEGIWIRLELKHSIQTLLDSCGNGKLSV